MERTYVHIIKPLRYLKSRIPELTPTSPNEVLAEHFRCSMIYRTARYMADRGQGDKVRTLAQLELAHGSR
jgi:hypothetical protein